MLKIQFKFLTLFLISIFIDGCSSGHYVRCGNSICYQESEDESDEEFESRFNRDDDEYEAKFANDKEYEAKFVNDDEFEEKYRLNSEKEDDDEQEEEASTDDSDS